MKLLLDTHNLGKNAGGIETYNNFLIKEINKKHNISLSLYVNKKHNKTSNQYKPLIKNGLYRILIGFHLAIIKTKPDIIHCNNFIPFPKPKNTLSIVTIHDLYFLKEKGFLIYYLFKFLLVYTVKNCNHIITNSNHTKNQILKFVSQPSIESKITVTHLGVNPIFKKSKKTIPTNKPFLLYPVNLTQRKNPHLVIKLADYLKTNHPNTKIYITGKNMSNTSLNHPNITILNYIHPNKLNSLYNTATSIIYPALHEGFGLPILEAAATKTPTLCSDIPPFREITGNSVLYCNTLKQWISSIDIVLKGKYPPTLIEKAYQNQKKYSWKKTTSQTLQVYNQLLKKVK